VESVTGGGTRAAWKATVSEIEAKYTRLSYNFRRSESSNLSNNFSMTEFAPYS
jgi:hypothetical protein